MNYEAVYRTAPATPGLLNITNNLYLINNFNVVCSIKPQFWLEVPFHPGAKHDLSLFPIYGRKMAICVASDQSQLVLHGIKVVREPVLCAGVVVQPAGDWPLLHEQKKLSHLPRAMKIGLETKAIRLHWPVLPGHGQLY